MATAIMTIGFDNNECHKRNLLKQTIVQSNTFNLNSYMEYISVQDSLITFDKQKLIGKFIQYKFNEDSDRYDRHRFVAWLERNFLFDIYDHFEGFVLFEIIYTKESSYCSPYNYSNK